MKRKTTLWLALILLNHAGIRAAPTASIKGHETLIPSEHRWLTYLVKLTKDGAAKQILYTFKADQNGGNYPVRESLQERTS